MKRNLKKVLSFTICFAIILSIATTAPLNASAQTLTYNYDGFSVTYTVNGGWADNENIQITLTNTGTEPIRNWGLQYEPHGNIVGIWNGEVVPSGGIGENIVKSVMHNSDIPVGASVSFGYTLMNVTGTPDSFTLCNYRVEKEDGYTVSLTTNPDWGDGFTGLITIANTTNTPIMAWELGFNANFAITSAGDFKILDSVGTYYKITGFQHNGNIPANSSITLNFNAASAPDAAIGDFSLTEIVVSATPPVPDEPEPCEDCGEEPCVCLNEPEICEDCGEEPCVCLDESEICGDCGEFPCICFDFVRYSVNAEAVYDSYNALTTISWEATEPTGTFEVFYSSDNDEYFTLTTVEDLFSYEYQTSGEDFVINYFKVNQVIDEEIAAVSNICYVIWSPAGILPTEYLREWEIETDSEVLSEINGNNPHFQLSIELEAAGVPSVQLNAAQSGYSYAMQNDMTLGIIPELIYPEDFNIGNVALKFEIADEYLDNVLGIYSEHPELEGIKRLNVFKWFDELNMSLPIETKFDVANNVLYTEVDRLGTYAIMDMEMWFEFLEANVEDELYDEMTMEEMFAEDEEEEEYEGTTEVQLSIPLMGAGNSTNPDNPITYSFPQIEFVEQEAPEGYWNSVVYGNGMFVAVGYLGIITSLDGINWTKQQTTSVHGRDIAYGNGKFVIVSTYSVFTSSDAVNWTEIQTNSIGVRYLYSVTYGNGLFVAVASHGVMTSPDGINWTLRQTPPGGDNWLSVTYGDNRFVAVGHMNNIMTSVDGINWTLVYYEDDYISMYGVTYGDGKFVAAGVMVDSNEEYVMTSPNGINWTAQKINNVYTCCYDITYSDGAFVMVGYSIDGDDKGVSSIMTSPDGIKWTIRLSPQDYYLQGVAYGNGMFVAVGANIVLTAFYEPGFKIITASGWKEITLDGIPSSYNGIDTDGDGLTDWEEIATDCNINVFSLTADGNYIKELPTIRDCYDYLIDTGVITYIPEWMERFVLETLGGSSGVEWLDRMEYIMSREILPIRSNPVESDSDKDGLLDGEALQNKWGFVAKDPEPLRRNNFIPLGTDEYFDDLSNRMSVWFEYFDEWNNSKWRDINHAYSSTVIEWMMSDVNNSEFHYLIPFEYWDEFCENFNSHIQIIGFISDKELHYFRNKLNRVPESLYDLLEEKHNWVLYEAKDSQYHMFNTVATYDTNEGSYKGEYNLKFVSTCGKYEAVYNYAGILLNEHNDPVNMGTYNYGITSIAHLLLDVVPYSDESVVSLGSVILTGEHGKGWFNVPGGYVDCSARSENLNRFNNNISAQQFRQFYEVLI
ncbi:MAG: cellulose binding domain-containing protein [Oscillospiraceae bacterium]|nr:cellulose binding domain-containing protein [Oscillospiraceae bacterium]